MFISDEIFEEIFRYYKMTEAEAANLIENIRSYQVAIFFQTFFMYYEDKKSVLEQKYLKQIIDNLENPNDLQKLASLIEQETTFNPDIRVNLRRKMEDSTLEIIVSLLENVETEAKQKIFDILYAQGYLAQQLLSPSPAAKTAN